MTSSAGLGPTSTAEKKKDLIKHNQIANLI